MNTEVEGVSELLETFRNQVRDLFDDRFVGEVAALIIFNERQRTQRGVDVDGRPFAPYAEMTRRIRQQKGRQTETVDLLFTGAMLNSLTFRAIERMAGNKDLVVFFNRQEEAEKALKHILGDGVPQRRFHGIDDQTEAQIRQMVADRIQKVFGS